MYHDHNVFITDKLDVLRQTSLTAVFSNGMNEKSEDTVKVGGVSV
jgi:hypothetical protein